MCGDLPKELGKHLVQKFMHLDPNADADRTRSARGQRNAPTTCEQRQKSTLTDLQTPGTVDREMRTVVC